MEFTKIIVTLALTFAVATVVADHSPLPSRRVSRFLQANNPRAAARCQNNGEVCTGTTSTCCSNSCVDLTTDNNNCGKCGRMCKYREACCGGKCVDIVFDKRHCGACYHRCEPGHYCVYGMCNYA
ncbi:hypothetical protein like AT5G55110 [Hibiscus trionum]|uniref:Stigma-specific STIG1-like protein 1 n=1 Tax=Hibiscus trionum TaxID=183268 RepID=A0A9W7JID5_HIBTR|nr:hypothetical protein like AT5G55110 [Hibiscus trionum]